MHKHTNAHILAYRHTHINAGARYTQTHTTLTHVPTHHAHTHTKTLRSHTHQHTTLTHAPTQHDHTRTSTARSHTHQHATHCTGLLRSLQPVPTTMLQTFGAWDVCCTRWLPASLPLKALACLSSWYVTIESGCDCGCLCGCVGVRVCVCMCVLCVCICVWGVWVCVCMCCVSVFVGGGICV